MKIIKIILLINLIFFVSCTSHKVNREKLMLARKYADQGTQNIMKGDLEQAKANFDLSLEVASIPESYDGLGCIAFYKKDYKQAEEYFIKAYNEDKNYLRALSNLALLYDVIGLKEEAKNIYEFIIEKNPEDYRFRNNFAGLLYDTDSEGKARAKEELRKAITLRKDEIIVNNMKKVDGTYSVKASNKGDKKKLADSTNSIKDDGKDIKAKKLSVSDKTVNAKSATKNNKKEDSNSNEIDIDSFKF